MTSLPYREGVKAFRDPHVRQFSLWMTGYVVAIAAGAILVSPPARPDAAHLAAALIPLIPLGFALTQTYRMIRAMDELQRRIHVEGLLISLIGTCAIVLGVGLLQMIAGLPTFTVFWLWIPICILYAVGVAAARRRYA